MKLSLHSLQKFRAIIVAIAIGIFTVSVVTLIILGNRILDQHAALNNPHTDNLHWALGQLETDLLVLSASTSRPPAGSERDLADVRKRFNNFYSRVDLIAQGRAFAEIRENDEIRMRLGNIQQFLDDLIPLFDGPDAILSAELNEIHSQLYGVRDDIRSLAFDAIEIVALTSDAERQDMDNLMLITGVAALIFIIALTVSILFLFQQVGISIRAAQIADSSASALRQSRERLSATINAALDAIIVIDATGKIIEFNPAAERVFGYSKEKAINSDMGSLISADAAHDVYQKGISQFLKSGEGNIVDKGRIELSGLRSDGSKFPAELSIGSAMGSTGPIFVVELRDITDRKESERILTEARERAESADQAKVSFLAMMSHEMRTPLNGVLGTLDLLRATKLNKKQYGYIDLATESAEVLLRHVNDVLDIAVIERGETRLEAAEFDLGELMGSVVDISRAGIEMRGAALRVDLAPETLRRYVGDAHRIRQILLNLIVNANRFTTKGNIVIEVRQMLEGASSVEVEFSVTDNGIGIAPEDQERIFSDFATLNPSYSRDTVGVGLGLAICRRIVQRMGGKIGVDSELGKGSRFWVQLTLELAQTEEGADTYRTPQVNLVPARRLKVLVVEDNDINRIVTLEMLASAGHDAVGANDGFDGVKKAAEQKFDVILMDISMPRMDGIQASRAIRSGDGASRNSPICALTAHAMPEEREHFADSGMQHCLSKPLRMKSLIEALSLLDTGDAAESSVEVPDDTCADPGPLVDEDIIVGLAEILTEAKFAETVTRFCVELRERVPAIEAAAAARDIERLRTLSHKMLGSAGLIGAARLGAALLAVELACKSGQPDEAVSRTRGISETAWATSAVLSEFVGGFSGRDINKAADPTK